MTHRRPPSERRLEAATDPLVLRVTDQETARVVAVHQDSGLIVGAGCLVDSTHVLTCRHVVTASKRGAEAAVGMRVYVSLVGVSTQPTVAAEVLQVGGVGVENDLALLKIIDGRPLRVPPVEFASPLRHGGKGYSVLGFPAGDRQGRNATGRLNAADAVGLVQMDRGGALSVLGGFSGAPVWSPELHAFVGLVVTELASHDVSWCIPSRRLCEFHPDLRVRFRIPPSDRPVVHDWESDDPNVTLFGSASENSSRRLRATLSQEDGYYSVTATYECLEGRTSPRGLIVTFVTHPDFTEEAEDGYELFADLQTSDDGLTWSASTTFEPTDLFTLAAVGDGGDTVLTLDLQELANHEREAARRRRSAPSRRK